MGYDVSIFGLTILGILCVVVFSYKIAHSRVYPVGMVRKMMPASQDSVEEILACDAPQVDLAEFVVEGLSDREIARHFVLSEQTVKNHIYRLKLRASVKQRAKFVWQKPFRGLESFHEPEEVALEKEVAEHRETLEHHSDLFAELEKRVRRLEVESVKKSQETIEEKTQLPQVVH